MASTMKMSMGRFRAIVIPTVGLVTVACVGVSVAASIWSQSLDTYLGRGERIISANDSTNGWDVDYYDQQFDDTSFEDGSVANGLTVAKKVTDEGIVLLKNDGALPLAAESTITPFGFRYVAPVYGGSGSGAVSSEGEFVATPEMALKKNFTLNTDVAEALVNATPSEISADGITEASKNEETRGFEGASTNVLEFDPSVYDQLTESEDGSTGVVFVGRRAGEGGNLQTDGYADGTAHNLALTSYELETIKVAKQSTEKVVVVVNTPTIMDVSELLAGEYEVDAVVWVGFPGAAGFDSLSDILAGKVNPSGRTVDIWDADLLANPAIANFTPDRTYTNTADTQIASNYEGLFFSEYEENVYYGYRYYETAADLGFVDYTQSVDFPFGYGLSYSEFDQKIVAVEDDGEDVAVVVEVANTSDVVGKEVVQVYAGSDYTAFDTEYNIEKPVRELVAFDKVEVAAGQTEEVTLTFSKEDLAHYSNVRENPDGTRGAYVLEAGDYTVTLGKNSHDAWDTSTVAIAATEWFDSTNPRAAEIAMQSALDAEGKPLGYPSRASADPDAQWIAASNQFDVSSNYMDEQTVELTRSDWEGTQPTAPEDKALSDELLARASQFDPKTDPMLGDHEDSLVYAAEEPTEMADNGLVLSDLRGKDYYDPAWEQLLDQIDYDADDLASMLYLSAFTTAEVGSVGKPLSEDHDGPAGFNLTGAEGGPLSTPYATEVVAASTWNKELLYEFGTAIGQEALTIGYAGWYGPGMNIHRNPFTGRNWEYYSEDPLLTGALAARAVSGASDQGLVVYQKHFGLNQYDGPATAIMEWASEQAIREVYLKPWEIAMQDAVMTVEYISDGEGTVSTKTMRASTALMASASLMNGEWHAANYNLLTNVVRGEWGFEGVISTDMFLQNSPNITSKVFLSGTDLKMWFAPSDDVLDMSSATAKETVRRAVHNVGYAYANSNLMQGAAPGVTVTYSMSPWVWWVVAINAVGLLIVAGLIVLLVRRSKDARENPEKYRGAGQAGA